MGGLFVCLSSLIGGIPAMLYASEYGKCLPNVVGGLHIGGTTADSYCYMPSCQIISQ